MPFANLPLNFQEQVANPPKRGETKFLDMGELI